jgi:hypothetical protein
LTNITNPSSVKIEDNKTILEPRLQLNDDDYMYLKSDSARIMENGEYELYNVETSGTRGTMKADILYIRNKKDKFEFKKNVKFHIREDLIKEN